MLDIDTTTALATVVGLLVDFSNRRSDRKGAAEFSEFAEWMKTEGHSDLLRAIEQNHVTCVSIKALLVQSNQMVGKSLQEVSSQLDLLIQQNRPRDPKLVLRLVGETQLRFVIPSARDRIADCRERLAQLAIIDGILDEEWYRMVISPFRQRKKSTTRWSSQDSCDDIDHDQGQEDVPIVERERYGEAVCDWYRRTLRVPSVPVYGCSDLLLTCVRVSQHMLHFRISVHRHYGLSGIWCHRIEGWLVPRGSTTWTHTVSYGPVYKRGVADVELGSHVRPVACAR